MRSLTAIMYDSEVRAEKSAPVKFWGNWAAISFKLTSLPSYNYLIYASIIFTFSSTVFATPKYIILSNRPVLSNAESNKSGLLVAPIVNIPGFLPTPSISVSSYATIRSMT